MHSLPTRDGRTGRLARNLMLAGAAFTAGLICVSVARYPPTLTTAPDGALGLIGSLLILLAYAAIGQFAAPAAARRAADVTALRLGLLCGGLISALFLIEMLIGYLTPLTEAQNAVLGTVMYGGFVLLLLAAGSCGGWRTRSVAGGTLAAIWSALLASLAWLAALWLTCHLFWGTSQEARQFMVDQVLADFRRSGGADLRAFVLQDNLGGSFFHLLLGPLLAALAGTLGGLAGAGLARLRASHNHGPA